MLLVIFGAGASYDSLDRLPPPPVPRRPESGWDYAARPPLASQLFGQQFSPLLTEFPSMRVVYDELRRTGGAEDGPTIEETLESFQDEALSGADAQRWIHMGAIRFYLMRALRMCDEWPANFNGVTNYTRLVGQVRRWADRSSPKESVTFATFNYDTLLDDACYELGIYRDQLESYVSDRYALVKFHGSVHWVNPITNAVELFGESEPRVREIIRQFARVKASDDVKLATPAEMAVRENGRTGSLPGLAVPLVTKAAAICPRDQLDRLDYALSNCDRLLVIGWRGAESHFWKRVTSRARDARVHLVNQSANIDKRLATGLSELMRVPLSRVAVSSGGFSQFMGANALGEFLDS